MSGENFRIFIGNPYSERRNKTLFLFKKLEHLMFDVWKKFFIKPTTWPKYASPLTCKRRSSTKSSHLRQQRIQILILGFINFNVYPRDQLVLSSCTTTTTTTTYLQPVFVFIWPRKLFCCLNFFSSKTKIVFVSQLL